MSLYRGTGVVLRVQNTSSRFGARLEPFGPVDVQFYAARTLDIVTQVETVDGFGYGTARRPS